MALLGAFIDSRTSAGLTSDASLTFAHGLPTTPDFAIINYIATIATATNHFNLSVLFDATNVTVDNGGSTTSPNYRVVLVVAHSVIR